MKKCNLLFSAAIAMAAMVIVSCQKEQDTIAMTATVNNFNNNDGKIYLDNNRLAHWDGTDKVNINGTVYDVAVTNNGGQEYATINNVTVNENGYCAVYPASMTNDNDGTGFPTVSLPQVQEYREVDGRQVVDAPMAAYSSNTGRRKLQFTNLCNLLKVTLSTTKNVAGITVCSEPPETFTGENMLWGTSTISMDGNGHISMSAPANDVVDGYCVMLDCRNGGSGVSSANGKPFYIVLPANVTLNNVYIQVWVYHDGAIATEEELSNSSITLASNKVYTYALTKSNWEVREFPDDVATRQYGFSVSSTKRVYFSPGNLQYQASTGTWRFALNQWDSFIATTGGEGGNTTSSSRGTQVKWIDLFGWASSGHSERYRGTLGGWESLSHSPTLTETQNHYCPGAIEGSISSMGQWDLVDSLRWFDWGHNPIYYAKNFVNGAQMLPMGTSSDLNTWRGLQNNEWTYVLNGRALKYAIAFSGRSLVSQAIPSYRYVTLTGLPNGEGLSNGTKAGLIVYPDKFIPKSPYLHKFYCVNNTVSYKDWQYLEQCGCVFLPVTGYRDGTTINDRSTGFYWSISDFGSSTLGENGNFASHMHFGLTIIGTLSLATDDSSVGMSSLANNMSHGHAVRLVRPVGEVGMLPPPNSNLHRRGQ